MLNISLLVFLFRSGFLFYYIDVHIVCGFIITPRLRDMRFTKRLKRTHIFVRYDPVLDREIVTRQLGGPCIHRRGSDHGVRVN
jgi:uncharacterized membrane protein YciS (DUF1049 family)